MIERIGHGATGRVWRASHSTTGDVVAVKELRSEFADDDVARGRFLQEGRLLQSHQPPGAVRVIDVIDDEEAAAIVMDLIDGVTLRQVVIDDAPLDVQRAVSLTLSLSRCVAAAHDVGLVHGDVKPENALIVDRGLPTEATVLTDFGLARVVRGSASANTRSQIMGTPHYAAPEIHRGQDRGRPADVYALGIILYELVTGHRPFEAQSVEAVMRAHLDDIPPRTDDFSGELWATTAACLAKDPAARPDAARLSQRLRQILDERLTSPEALATRQWHKGRPAAAGERHTGGGKPALTGIAAAAVLTVAAGGIGFTVLRDRRADVDANMVPQAGTVSSTPVSSPSASASTSVTTATTPSVPPVSTPQQPGGGSGGGVGPAPTPGDSPGQIPPGQQPPQADPPPNDGSPGGQGPVTPGRKPQTPSKPTGRRPSPKPPNPPSPKPPPSPPRITPSKPVAPLGPDDSWRRKSLPDGRRLEVNLQWNRTRTHNDWTKVVYRVSGGGSRAYAINLALYEAGKEVYFVAMNAEPGGDWRSVSLKGHATRPSLDETFQVQVYAAHRKPPTRLALVKFSY